MKRYLVSMVAGMFLAVPSLAVDSEHVTNGSFEAGATVTVYDIAYEDADDWDFQTPTGDIVNYRVGNFSGAPWYRTPSDGDHFVSLHNLGGGEVQTGWLSQRLVPLVIGETYTVSFDVTCARVNPGDSSTYEIYIGGTLVKEGTIQRYGWYSYTVDYTANVLDGESPMIRLVHTNRSGEDRWMCFDNVSVFGAENVSPATVVVDEQVVNGSFELGDTVSGSGAISGTGITDSWVSGSDGGAYTEWRVVGPDAPWYKEASDGDYYAALANQSGAVMESWLEQELGALKVGEVYTVSMDVVLKPESDSTVSSGYRLMIGDTEVLGGTVQRYGWYSFSTVYLANADDGETPMLRLVHYNPSGWNLTMCYDNVSVTGLVNPRPDGCPVAYMAMDLNQDCYINLIDFAMFTDDWMNCNEPADASCW